jgi:hypothetical protein
MTHRAPRDAARRLIVSFVLALLAPATALVWLGLRFIEQDRALIERQFRERREGAADRTIAGLEQALASTERRLAGDPSDVGARPDDDAVVLTWTPAGIDVWPAGRLLYLPAPPPDAEESTDVFAPGEALEFRAKDHQAAARVFQGLTVSASPDVRAGALLRLARTLRKSGGHDQALKAYADLTLLPGVRRTSRAMRRVP